MFPCEDFDVMIFCLDILQFSLGYAFHSNLSILALTMVGLMITPRFLDPPEVIEDENTELLRQAVAFRRRRGKKIN